MGHGDMREELGGDASQALEHVRIELSREGVRAECMALPGTSAPAALHYAAESCDVGLLVLGSSRRGPGGLLRLGSTGERLVHGAPCPLAIVPAEWEGGGGLHTVGVAYTDTPEGRAALASAIALARRAGAKLRILSAVKAGEGGGDEAAKDSTGHDAGQATRRILAEAGAQAAGVDVEADVGVQDPA